jgi:CHAT domain-containing protein
MRLYEQSQQQKRRPLFHIASHFRFVAEDEASSFLLLGDGKPFTLEEMKKEQNLFAGIDLLALSACETAAQRTSGNGREVDGFAELAQRLGAEAVTASLWEVADDSTAELMTRFYQNYNQRTMQGGKMNKAEA